MRTINKEKIVKNIIRKHSDKQFAEMFKQAKAYLVDKYKMPENRANYILLNNI